MSPYFKQLHIIVLLCLFIHINSQRFLIKANNIVSSCEVNLYKIIINIDITPQLNEYKSFYLNAIYEKGLLFKCILDPKKKQIICITNLEQQKIYLKEDISIILPYPFPKVEGINWDYPTFMTTVYRRAINLENGCGLSVIKKNFANVNPSKWDLLAKINKIYDGQCLLSDTSDNFYSFMMNIDILGGKLNDTLFTNKKASITFMQNITLPFLIGKLRSLSNTMDIFYDDTYYKNAFCYPLEDLTYSNYLNENGIDFKCNIPISEQYIFNGPLKITDFTDNIYAKVVSDNTEIDYISIYFTVQKDAQVNKGEDDTDDEEEKIDENDDDDFDEEEEEENTEPKKKREIIKKILKFQALVQVPVPALIRFLHRPRLLLLLLPHLLLLLLPHLLLLLLPLLLLLLHPLLKSLFLQRVHLLN